MSNYFDKVPDFEYVSRLPDANISDYIPVKNLFKKEKNYSKTRHLSRCRSLLSIKLKVMIDQIMLPLISMVDLI